MKKLCIHLYLGLLMFSIACTDETDPPDSAPVPGRHSSKVALDRMDLATSKVRSDALPRTPRIRIYAYSSLGLYESQLPEIKDYQSLFTYFSGQTGEHRVRDGIDFRLPVKAGQHPRKRIAEEINKLPFKIRYTHL